jgi:polysaccharide pyruvyl transferase WcaK-like protein
MSPERANLFLMGGGTLVGRSMWRGRLLAAESISAGPAFFTGVGVEDPSFDGARTYTDDGELRRWADILAGAEIVTVRGPMSQALLQSVGVHAEIASDPALLLQPPQVEHEARVLGLNVALPEDLYRDAGSYVDETISMAQVLTRDGWNIRLLPFTTSDYSVSEIVAKSLGGGVEIIEAWHSVPQLLAHIARCDVVVGQRLHAVVLASACAVPAVALDYRPKCRDFQASLGREQWCQSIVALRGPALVDAVMQLHEDREGQSSELGAAVERYREVLIEDELRIAKSVF